MLQYYPLNPVVTSNAVLASLYNEDPRSTFLTSACVSPAEFEEMVTGGARFDAVVLVDGVGQDVVAKKLVADDEAPRIEVFDGSNKSEAASVSEIQGLIGESAKLFDVAG